MIIAVKIKMVNSTGNEFNRLLVRDNIFFSLFYIDLL